MSDKTFVGYEYQEVAVKNGMTSIYADGYENFGWKLENSDVALGKPDSVVMRFKRDRKLRNKPELTRLQRQFDAIVSDIVSLESSKRTKASIAAFTVGILGTAFMAGSVFAITAGLLLPCIPCSPRLYRLDRPLFPLSFHGEEKDRIRHSAD